MDNQAELRGFLSSRRARITPEEAGVPAFTGSRRVPGLRREEVAHLAAISVDYYTRLERGKITGVSDEVLESVARALQLDDMERDHLLHLARSMRGTRATRPSRRVEPRVGPKLQQVLESITVPALIQNTRLDVLAANHIGWAVYPHAQEAERGAFNHLKFQLLDPRARTFYREWDLATSNAVALLRAAAGRDPGDDGITRLVGELSTHSERFRQLWASSHDVLRSREGVKKYLHPLVGPIDFDFTSFDVAGEPGLVMLVYSVQPDSSSADALQILANWSAASREGAATDPGSNRSSQPTSHHD